jgi:hypothetical protein
MNFEDRRMTQFLIDLSIDDTLRERFNENRAAVLSELVAQGMSELASMAIDQRQGKTISMLLVNNQSNGGGLVEMISSPVDAVSAAAPKGGKKRKHPTSRK